MNHTMKHAMKYAMKHAMKHGIVLLALAALPVWAQAQAQSIWRCGSDGRSFSDTPCGEGRVVMSADTRPRDDVAAAQAMADREKRLAERLRLDRLREEAAQRGNGLAALGPQSSLKRAAPATKPQPLRAQRPPDPAAGGTWRAVAPASRRGKG